MLVTSAQEMPLSVSIIHMLVTITQEMLSHQGGQYHINSNCYQHILIVMSDGPVYKPL